MIRDGLLDLGDGRCASTGRASLALLPAKHNKPWRGRETDSERLDVYNGIPLTPLLGSTYEQSFVTMQDDSVIVASDALNVESGDEGAQQ